MNIFRSFALLSMLTALFILVGFLLAGTAGIFIALVIGLLLNVFTYFYSDKIVLRHYKAYPINPHNAPELYHVVEGYAQKANMPTPNIYQIENSIPNAFATGRNPQNGVIVLTTSLMRQLNREEIEGVIAHELAHIKHYDTLLMTIASVFASAISILSHFALFFGNTHNSHNSALNLIGKLIIMFTVPMVAGIMQMAISRTREYAADKYAAQLTHNPLALASALKKIEKFVRDNHTLQGHNTVRRDDTALSHMFIINPFVTRKGDSLFSTHPSTANRVEALENMHEMLNNK